MKNKMLIIGLMIVTIIGSKCFGAAQATRDFDPFVSDFFLHYCPRAEGGVGKDKLILRIDEIRNSCPRTTYVFDAVRLARKRDKLGIARGSCKFVMDDGDPYPKGILSKVSWRDNLKGFSEVEVETLIPVALHDVKSWPVFCEATYDGSDEVLTEVSEVVVLLGGACLRVGRKHHMKIATPLFKELLEYPMDGLRAASKLASAVP
jgi:hypothetical protein